MHISTRGNGVYGLMSLLGSTLVSIFGGAILADVELLSRFTPRWLAERMAGFFLLGGLCGGFLIGGALSVYLGRAWKRDWRPHDIAGIGVHVFGIAWLVIGLLMLCMIGIMLVIKSSR